MSIISSLRDRSAWLPFKRSLAGLGRRPGDGDREDAVDHALRVGDRDAEIIRGEPRGDSPGRRLLEEHVEGLAHERGVERLPLAAPEFPEPLAAMVTFARLNRFPIAAAGVSSRSE